jgi:histidine ammonia-lyase
MSKVYHMSNDPITLEDLKKLLSQKHDIVITDERRQAINHCRAYLEEKLTNTNARYYGINTGFGSLCNIVISAEETKQLQRNLVKSHACGTGNEVPLEVIRLMLLLKIKNLAQGYSGVRAELVDRLVFFYNQDILPVIYEQGSLGASGDLAPLAHLSLPLIGLGEVHYHGQKCDARKVLDEFGLSPLQLEAKEGLALLNGTQFSGAYTAWAVVEAHRLFKIADLCAALSVDAFDCRLSPFDERLHQIRNHKGQQKSAASILNWLEGSAIGLRPKEHVQDPYAFRCVPQVHGASWDALEHVSSVLLKEANAVTDNPNIFPDADVILSGGNFHAQPLALVLDYLAIALAEMGSISERRVYQLISGTRGLPSFLAENPGLHSGLMIPQYTAASIASQNKQLCTPASVDSIISSNGQEDHVSMAANAATKCYQVVKNVERLLAIEWMTAVQALYFRRPERTSPQLEFLIEDYRLLVPPITEDRMLYRDIEATIVFLRGLRW